MLPQAKALIGDREVKFSSILPPIDDEKPQLSIEQINSSAEDVCKKTGVTFIENDSSFCLGDSVVNEGFLKDDGYSLNNA